MENTIEIFKKCELDDNGYYVNVYDVFIFNKNSLIFSEKYLSEDFDIFFDIAKKYNLLVETKKELEFLQNNNN